MSFIQVINSIQGGGAENASFNLHKAAENEGLHSVVISLFANSNRKFNGLIEIYEKRLDRFKFIYIPLVLIRLFKVLRKYPNCTVVAHLPLAILLCRLIHHRTICVIHSTYSIRSTKVKIVLLKFLFHNARCVAVSNAVAQDFRKLGIKYKSLDVINNAFHIDEIKDLSLQQCQLKTKKPFILYCGRLIKSKRVDILITLMTLLKNKYDLVIVGDGEEMKNLLGLSRRLDLEHAVYFEGWQPNPYPYIKQCEYCVSASMYEGLPSSLIEALILSKVTISTAYPAAIDLFSFCNQRNIVESNATESYLKTLEHLENHPIEINAFDSSQYSFRVVLNKYLALME